MKISYYNQSGFSLVETLVAVSLLLIIIVGPMTISAKSAKSSTFATEQIQAFFLAQEGLELAQKARDDLSLKYFAGTELTPWTKFTDINGVYKFCFNGTGCGLQWGLVDGELAVPINCNVSATACKLYLGSSGRSWFTHSGASSDDKFTRKIYFSTNNATREVSVRSVVTWRTGSIVADQKVELDTYLFNITY